MNDQPVRRPTTQTWCGLLAAAALFGSAGNVAAAEWERPKLKLASADGQSSIEFHLALQLRWEYLYQDQGTGKDRTSQSKLMLRRIRPTLSGSLLTEELTWLLHLSTAPGSLELMDLWIDYKIHPWLQVQVGQMKIPFTRYRLNSFQDRPLVEWSYPTHYFGAERQLGVMLHNGVGKPPDFEFELGVFDGVNARASNGIGAEKVYAEPPINPSNLAQPTPLEHLHTELVLHLAYNYGGIHVRRPSDLEGGPPRFSVGASLAWDLNPRPLHDLQLRVAPEAEFRWAGFAIGGQFYLGLFDPLAGGDGYQPGLLGGLVYASYFFGGAYEISARWANVSILSAYRTDARTHADAKIAAAGDETEAAALGNRYARTGRLHNEQEINLGFNWYLLGTTLKWQIDLGLLVHELDSQTLYDAQLRTQLQLAF